MTEAKKYVVREAATLAAREHYRHLLEQELARPGLSDEHREELVWALKKARTDEENVKALKEDGDEDAEEKGDKEKGRDGKGTQSGGNGGGGGGGAASTSEDVTETNTEIELEASEDASQVTSLLFFLAGQDVDLPDGLPGAAYVSASDLAVAAATLIYEEEAQIAHLHEPFSGETDSEHRAAGDILPSVEEHAASLGAKVLQLKVFANAVEAFQHKFGYQPYGRPNGRPNSSMQVMRKTLRPASLIKQNVPY